MKLPGTSFHQSVLNFPTARGSTATFHLIAFALYALLTAVVEVVVAVAAVVVLLVLVLVVVVVVLVLVLVLVVVVVVLA